MHPPPPPPFFDQFIFARRVTNRNTVRILNTVIKRTQAPDAYQPISFAKATHLGPCFALTSFKDGFYFHGDFRFVLRGIIVSCIYICNINIGL